jgi:glyoxalase family protein
MPLEGPHHVTMITADATRNVDFYAGVLGLRLVKQTVNFDQPDAYHLYFGDESGAAGSLLTWFEFPGAAPGTAGAGMVHTIRLGVPADGALDFWDERLRAAGVTTERGDAALGLRDPEGLRFELVVAAPGNPPLRATHPEIAPEHAIAGIEGARAYAAREDDGTLLTGTLGFVDLGAGEYRLDGTQRAFGWGYDRPPAARGLQGAGSVHHIAWASRDEDHLDWQRAVAAAGFPVTDVRDRDYFRSIYFPEPRGVLFEIATLSPGFAVDEDPAHLGEELRVPAMHAQLRERLERTLTPIVNPRAAKREALA